MNPGVEPRGAVVGRACIWRKMSEQRMALLVEVEEGAPTGGLPWAVTAYRFVALLQALRCIAIGHHAATLMCGSCEAACEQGRRGGSRSSDARLCCS